MQDVIIRILLLTIQITAIITITTIDVLIPWSNEDPAGEPRYPTARAKVASFLAPSAGSTETTCLV